MTSTPFHADVVLVFTGRSASMNIMSATPSRVRMEAPALMAWAPTTAPVPRDTTDRTARYCVCACVHVCVSLQVCVTVSAGVCVWSELCTFFAARG